MKPHVKIYADYFGITPDDVVVCEVCHMRPIADIHHIFCRGMGGSKNKDVIENLIGVCRECHIMYGDKKQYYDLLIAAHAKSLRK